MSKAVYPGSFDPFSNGHLDIVKRASKLFDEIHVLVSNNIFKKTIFSTEERINLIKKCTTDIPNLVITSFDGLKLRGKYYEYAPGAPIELMFHGYRGTAERDLSGGKQRCFQLGHSALIVNQRASIGSEGNVISFGVNESRDCLDWVNFMVEHFGPEVRIILCGISMGAATVLIATGQTLPSNVIGVLADCGYNSQKGIIQTVIRKLKLPVAVVYPFVKLAARLYGRFDLEACSPEEAVKRCTVPVIFFHGEEDDFVPCEMSRVNYEACAARKRLVTVPGAGHGLSYPVAPEVYLRAMREFFGNGEETRE